MDIEDVIDLLTIVAVGDKRTVGQSDAIQWHRIIGHLNRDECTEAIEAHRREQPGVWLEPGHILGRVKAKQRDRLDRMDPDDRAQAIAEGYQFRDRYGVIDKSTGDVEDYPEAWTSEQRVSEYWRRIDASRDRAEREMARGNPGSLLLKPPASAPARAKAVATFAAQTAVIEADDSVPHVNPLQVRCRHCTAETGRPCTTPGMPGQPRDKMSSFHPSRVEQAAIKQGVGKDAEDPEVKAVVAAACKRQVSTAKARWTDKDVTQMPLPGSVWESQAPSSGSAPENLSSGQLDGKSDPAVSPVTPPEEEGF